MLRTYRKDSQIFFFSYKKFIRKKHEKNVHEEEATRFFSAEKQAHS